MSAIQSGPGVWYPQAQVQAIVPLAPDPRVADALAAAHQAIALAEVHQARAERAERDRDRWHAIASSLMRPKRRALAWQAVLWVGMVIIVGCVLAVTAAINLGEWLVGVRR